MEKLQLIRVLHIVLNIPILIYENTCLMHEFHANANYHSSYKHDIHSLFKQLNDKVFVYKLIAGKCSELFLLYKYKEVYLILGPFRTVNGNTFTNHLNYDYLEKLPYFSLFQIRHLILLIHYLLTNDYINPNDLKLCSFQERLNTNIMNKHMDYYLIQDYDPDNSIFLYEN